MLRVHTLLTFWILAGSVFAWDNDDLEVFDVVEEVNQNFYELLGVTQDATPQDIKSAFKRLTLKLHPDKSDAPDADVQFRNLVSVHNILKDPSKREKYNEVLKNGLPNWRSALYYYRHVRKMGLAEGSAILFIIITLGQYAVGWAAYVEKKFTAEQILNSRTRRQQKKGAGLEVAEILQQFPKPSVLNTLPFQIPKWIYTSVVSIPGAALAIHQHIKHKKEEQMRQIQKEKEEAERAAREEAELAAARAARAAGGGRKRRGFVPVERQCLLDPVDEPAGGDEAAAQPTHKAPLISGGLWTDDDLAELVRLVKKYPPGAPERWDRIADAMQRSVHEVTHMAAKLKDNCYRVPGQEDPPTPSPDVAKKIKTRKNETEAAAAAANWSQQQQSALEAALAKYPKSGAGDRWDKISKCVPGKTKEECMLRCKYLADVVRKQKLKEEQQETEPCAEPEQTT